MSVKNTRTLAQTNNYIEYILDGKNKTQVAERSSSCGIHPVESPLGSTVDIGLRSPPCVGHMIKYGLMKKYSKAIWYWLKPDQRIELDARMRAFEYPRGVSVIAFDISKSLGTNIQMKLYRKLMLLWPMLLSDMFDHRTRIWRGFILLCQVDFLIYTYWHHRNLPLVKAKTRKLIEVLRKLKKPGREKDTDTAKGEKQKKSKFPNFDSPGTHQLIELVNRFLPLYENIIFFDTTFFESCHKFPKRIVRSSQCSTNRHNDVSRKVAQKDSYTVALQGMRWGPQYEYRLGSFWRCLKSLKDPTKPHPLIRGLTKYASSEPRSRPSNIRRINCGHWEPTKKQTPLGQRMQDYKIVNNYLLPLCKNLDSEVTLREPAMLVNEHYCIQQSLAPSDDICFKGDMFGRISNIIEASFTYKECTYQLLLLVILSYQVKITPGALSKIFLRKNFKKRRVIGVSLFEERCLVAHACNKDTVHVCEMRGKNFIHNDKNINHEVRTESDGLFFDSQILTPNWFDKSQKPPTNPLERSVKYQTKSGTLKCVRPGNFAVLLIQEKRIGVCKVINKYKGRTTIRWYGDPKKPNKLLVQYQPLSKGNRAWNQYFADDCAVIAADFQLVDGTLPSEVFHLMDWDSRTNWNYEADFYNSDAESESESEPITDSENSTDEYCSNTESDKSSDDSDESQS